MWLTKLFLAAIAVQVNPQFAADVILDTGVFLIVKSIQSPADNCIHLNGKQSSLLTENVTKRLKLKASVSLKSGQFIIKHNKEVLCNYEK